MSVSTTAMTKTGKNAWVTFADSDEAAIYSAHYFGVTTTRTIAFITKDAKAYELIGETGVFDTDYRRINLATTAKDYVAPPWTAGTLYGNDNVVSYAGDLYAAERDILAADANTTPDTTGSGWRKITSASSATLDMNWSPGYTYDTAGTLESVTKYGGLLYTNGLANNLSVIPYEQYSLTPVNTTEYIPPISYIQALATEQANRSVLESAAPGLWQRQNEYITKYTPNSDGFVTIEINNLVTGTEFWRELTEADSETDVYGNNYQWHLDLYSNIYKGTNGDQTRSFKQTRRGVTRTIPSYRNGPPVAIHSTHTFTSDFYGKKSFFMLKDNTYAGWRESMEWWNFHATFRPNEYYSAANVALGTRAAQESTDWATHGLLNEQYRWVNNDRTLKYRKHISKSNPEWSAIFAANNKDDFNARDKTSDAQVMDYISTQVPTMYNAIDTSHALTVADLNNYDSEHTATDKTHQMFCFIPGHVAANFSFLDTDLANSSTGIFTTMTVQVSTAPTSLTYHVRNPKV